MTVVTVDAESLNRSEGWTIETGRDGVRVAPGGSGYALFGPYRPAEGGVYLVTVDAELTDPNTEASVFEVYHDGFIAAVRSYREPFSLVLRIDATEGLEFRFKLDREGVIVRSIKLESLLLDAEPADAAGIDSVFARIEPLDVECSAKFRLLDRLALTGAADRAERERREWVAALPRRAVKDTMSRLNSPRALGAYPVRLSEAQVKPVVAGDKLTIFNLGHFSCDDQTRLSALGYEPEFLQATRRHVSYREAARPWQLSENYTENERSSKYRSLDGADFSFQLALARGEGFAAYDPTSGDLLYSQHGFLLHYHGMCFIFYRFDGREVFYVSSSEAFGLKRLIYLPATQTVISIIDPIHAWYPIRELIYRLNVNLASNAEAVMVYLRGETRPSAVCSNNNMGHFIWNDLAGLHHALEVGLDTKITEVVKLPAQALSIESVFPELSDRTVDLESHQGFRHCVENRLLPIRFTDAVFSPSFAERLRRTARRQRSSRDIASGADARPLIWVNLREHTKKWLEQVDGFAHILNSLYIDYGGVSAVIDGWTDCADLANAIRKRTRPEIVFHDGLGIELLDSLDWAFAVDAYVCTIGSGLVLLTWIAGKPGVAHAEQLHMEQMSWWGDVRPDVPPPLTPRLDEIVDADRGPYGTGLYCNYHLDPEIILNLLRTILDQKFPRRPLGQPDGELSVSQSAQETADAV